MVLYGDGHWQCLRRKKEKEKLTKQIVEGQDIIPAGTVFLEELIFVIFLLWPVIISSLHFPPVLNSLSLRSHIPWLARPWGAVAAVGQLWLWPVIKAPINCPENQFLNSILHTESKSATSWKSRPIIISSNSVLPLLVCWHNKTTIIEIMLSL